MNAADILRRTHSAPEPASSTAHSWPRPLPLSLVVAPPSFPLELLPPALRYYAAGLALELQVSPDVVAVCAIGVLSAAISRCDVQVRARWTEPCNLFTLALAGSADRKSAVVAAVRKPLDAFANDVRTDPDRLRAHAQSEAIHEAAVAQFEAAKSALRKPKLGLEDRRLAEGDLLAATEAKNAAPAPTLARLVVDDVTPEGLGRLLAANGAAGFGEVAALVGAENTLDALLGDRYEKGSPSFALKLHAGEPYSEARIGRVGSELRSPRLAIVAAMQPSAFEVIATNRRLRDVGFPARFMFAWPLSPVGSRDADPPTLDPCVRARFDDAVRRLSTTCAGFRGEGAPTMTLNLDAQREVVEFLRTTEPRLGPDGDLCLIGDWAGKRAGLAVRLSAVLHAVSCGGSPWDAPIEAATVKAAVAIIDGWATPHAMRVLSEITPDPITEQASSILNWIERGGHDQFTRAEVSRDLRRGAGWKTPDEADPPLGLLIDAGWIAHVVPPRGVGRPKGVTFAVSPYLKRERESFGDFVAEIPSSKVRNGPFVDFVAESQKSGEEFKSIPNEEVFYDFGLADFRHEIHETLEAAGETQ